MAAQDHVDGRRSALSRRCSRPTRTAASTRIGASIRSPSCAPPASGSRAAASSPAPRRSPCRPRACSSPRPRSLPTKTIESARALQLEWRYSKREVMAIYLTLAPMGGNLEGVRAASLAYFGKEPHHLSAAEAALLVAIPQSPERRRPDRSPAAAQAGRDRVLQRGLEHGVIDQALFDCGDQPRRAGAAARHADALRRISRPGSPASRPARSCRRRSASNCRARSPSSSTTNAVSLPTRPRSRWSRSTIAPAASWPGWAAATSSAAPGRSTWCAPTARPARR